MGFRMKWAFLITTGLAGLLLGGAAVAVAAVVIAQIALGVGLFLGAPAPPARPRPPGYTVLPSGA
jgi:hypothetical protein